MTRLRYREGEPVQVRERRREHWVELDDEGRAVELAGKPPGWLKVAERVVAEEGMNGTARGASSSPSTSGATART